MNVTAKVAWVIANLAWNAFVAFCAIALIDAVSSDMVREAASVGLVETSDAWLINWFFAFNGLAWLVSATCGWLAILELLPAALCAIWLAS